MRRRFANIGLWIVNLLLAAFIFEPAETFRPRLEAVLGIAFPSWPIANAGLTLLAGFLLLDFLRYAVHRCEHVVPLVWRFHALHHSDPDVDATTSVRHHPLEYLVASTIYWIALVLLDVPAFVALVHIIAVFGMTFFQHGNIRLPERLEHWLQPVLVTTDMHRIHHSIVFDHSNCNYGAVLSIWDRLFGTYARLTCAQHEHIVFGVRALPRRDCLKPSAMLLTPWRMARAEAVDGSG